MSLISCGRWKCHSFVKFESWRMKPTVWSASSRQAKLCTVRTAFRHWKGQRNTSEQCQLMQGVQSIPFSRRKSWRSRDLPLRTENAFTKVVTQHMGQRLRALHILIQRSMHSKMCCHMRRPLSVWGACFWTGNSPPVYKQHRTQPTQCSCFSTAGHKSLPAWMATELWLLHLHYLSKALTLFFSEQRVTKWVPIKPSILLLCCVGIFSTCSKVITPPSMNSTNRWWLPSSNTTTTTTPRLTVWLVGFLPSPTI